MPTSNLIALRVQAAYYIATGLWPLLSRRAFEAVTGPKQDWWLVQMVGLLAFTNGVALAAGSRRAPVSTQTRVLSLLSAASFALIDVVHASKRRISPIYLADAVVEAAMVACVEWPQHDERNDDERSGRPQRDGRRWLL